MSLFAGKWKLLKRMNWALSAAIIAMLVIGVFFVYSSCYVSEEQPVRSLYKKQIFWACAGMVCYLGFALSDYRSLRRISWWAYAGCLVLLVVVLFAGTKIYGARRWLSIFGIGVQPSELAKLATIIVLARKLSRPGIDLDQVRTLGLIMAIAAVPMLLIMRQPDLGTAMVFIPTLFLMMFAAGIHVRVLGVLIGVGVVCVGIVLGALFLPEKAGMSEPAQRGIMRSVGLSQYHKDRIAVFFQSDRDPLGAGWNKRQSEIAVGSGGVTGKGYLKGTQNVLGFLPRSVAPTDFIYSVIAEEKGFVGSMIVLVLYGVIVGGAMLTALSANDRMGRLISVGVTSLFISHVFINIAMTVGLMPITGLPLPLLSYGGSFMIVTMSALGIVQSIYIRSRPVGDTAQASYFSFG